MTFIILQEKISYAYLLTKLQFSGSVTIFQNFRETKTKSKQVSRKKPKPNKPKLKQTKQQRKKPHQPMLW